MLKSTHTGVAETFYEQVMNDIIIGKLAPEQKLGIDQLSRTYEVSATTVRETLIRLMARGLTQLTDNKGFSVTPISIKDLKEIAEMRYLLESFAMEKSFVAGDLHWESHVVAAHYRLSAMEKALAAGKEEDTFAWKQSDWEFHETLISACGSTTLMETHKNIFHKYLRYQVQCMSFRKEIGPKKHQALLDAALDRNAKLASQILEGHIAGAIEDACSSGKCGPAD